MKIRENFVPKETPGLPMPKEGPPTATLLQRMGSRDEGLDNVEEEKKGIVTREIDKFRETMKIREAEKEEQDKKRKGSKSPSRRKSKSRERDSESRSRDSRRRDRSRSKDRETRSSARRSRSRDKRRSVVSKSRSRSPPRFVREPVRSRERDTRTQKEILKEKVSPGISASPFLTMAMDRTAKFPSTMHPRTDFLLRSPSRRLPLGQDLGKFGSSQ